MVCFHHVLLLVLENFLDLPIGVIRMDPKIKFPQLSETSKKALFFENRIV